MKKIFRNNNMKKGKEINNMKMQMIKKSKKSKKVLLLK